MANFNTASTSQSVNPFDKRHGRPIFDCKNENTNHMKTLQGAVSRYSVIVYCCLAVWFCQSQVFAIAVGDRVRADGTVNVRSTAAGTLLGSQSSGSQGTVIAGPTVASLGGVSYTWFNINFDTGTDGWVATIGLVQVLTLNIASSNPNSGVYIYVGPNDILGRADGTTAFSRIFDLGASITLIAPLTAGGNNFQKWQRNGSDFSFSTTVNFSMSAAYTLTAVYAAPPPVTRTLTVNSSNPNSGVSISGNQPDNNGNYGGTTSFTRTFNNNATVSFNAPSTSGGNNFQKWQRDGVDLTTSTTASVTMDANHTITAVYVSPPTVYTLNIASSNPNSGVYVYVGPNDTLGRADGTTSFSRTFNSGTTITLIAPLTAGGNNFQKWQRNGSDFSFSTTVDFSMSANYTLTAVYVTAPPVTHTLTVASSNPNSGVSITANQPDNDNNFGGNTSFARTFNHNAAVSFNAPSTAGGNAFQKWQRDGSDLTTSTTASVTMDGDHTITAVYGPTLPTIQTLVATAVTANSAQLNGSINPNGSATTAYFEYGTTTGYGTTTSTGNFGTAFQNIGLNVSGLAPNTTYHYRIRASNSNGASTGNDVTFTTTGTGAPTIQTLAASAVTTSSAQLNGSINPNGFATAAYFEFGLTAGYGSTTASGNFGTTVQNIGFVQSGLSPNTTYHYRIVASNSQGTSRGTDATFTTLPTAATPQQAWVAGTAGLGLRLRSSPSSSASVLVVMPEGSSVALLGDTQTADGYLWRHLTYAAQTGWAAAQYLVFTPGTTPTPPADPIALRQLQPDGFSPIAAGGTATGSSVILAATPSGPSSQQFTVQFEVRASGTAFSAPTATTSPIQGGSEIRATVSALANQNYHWRARVLDGNGVPSQWVSFSANATDFTVATAPLPLALFTWSPAQVFTGDAVTFTAQAAAQAGLTFSWDFGGITTATGGTTLQTFAQSGNVAVTLTVTDGQGHQSQKTLTVPVASKELVGRIDAAAGQSASLLDSVQANATLAAGAADYFQQGVDGTAFKVALEGASAGISIIFKGLTAGNNQLLIDRTVAWTRQAYGNVAADELRDRIKDYLLGEEAQKLILKEFRSIALKEALKVPRAGQPFQDSLMPGLANLVTQKKAAIEQLRQQAIVAAGSLSPAQSELLARDIQARLLGNLALETSFAKNANLPVTFKEYKSSDESGWTTYNIGQHLFSVSAGLLGTTLGGMGGIVAGFAASATQAELDIFNTLAGQSVDAQLLSLSVGIASQGTTVAGDIATNMESGLNAVINSQSPTKPTGRLITINPFVRGTLRTYNLLPRWFASEAYSDILIENTGPQAATYRVEAFLTKTFTTGQLPVHFLGIGERQYDIDTATAKDGILLTPGQQATVRLVFLAGDGGLVPKGQDITYTLTALTSGGYYQQDSQVHHFGTTYLDENGNIVDPALVASASVIQSPIQSSLLIFPGSNICELKITAQNPIETPAMLNIGQDIPLGTVVLNAGGATIANNHMAWELDLQPGQEQLIKVVLQLPLPTGNPQVTNTTASVYDAVNATWVQFSQAPVVSQMVSSPPPQIQPAGFTGGIFGLDVQALIPGIYRVEGTSDFINWNPVSTVTNTAGSFQVLDPNAQSYPSRFYRASRR